MVETGIVLSLLRSCREVSEETLRVTEFGVPVGKKKKESNMEAVKEDFFFSSRHSSKEKIKVKQ
jgi:hypothetical protein